MLSYLCIVLLVALVGLACIWWSDHARSAAKIECLEDQRDWAVAELGGLVFNTDYTYSEMKRLRQDNLDLRCKLELIDEEVGFWVNDKMEVRWGAKGCVADSVLAVVSAMDKVDDCE